ncbi:basic endochitinase CHB4-like [Prunus avium]|uniref:Basic endochitinase CHB4-like n=1 Tax=Prunus avium TaxID=42229 RepID=A0A6P5SQL8_PRUAV|nr:basic endochitinase CHB4-like [Prunus avium]
MAFYNTITHLLSLIALVYVAGEVLKNLTAQSCGCAPEISCSQYGYCGSGDDYWGQGYKEGSCTSSGGSTTTTPRTNGGGGSSVADVVTPELFNKIIYKGMVLRKIRKELLL